MLSKLGGDGKEHLLSDADPLVDLEAPPRSARWEGPRAGGAATVGVPRNRRSLYRRQPWGHGAGSVLWDRDGKGFVIAVACGAFSVLAATRVSCRASGKSPVS